MKSIHILAIVFFLHLHFSVFMTPIILALLIILHLEFFHQILIDIFKIWTLTMILIPALFQ